jgi:HTH-type transcriptional regulator/antitoxin HigA
MSATAIKHYEVNGFVMPKPITSDAENEQYTAALLELESRDHLTVKERHFAEFLAFQVEAYEEKQYPIRSASPIEVLNTLMEANDLRQKDLIPEFGSESIVSAVLNGKRPFNTHHIERLSKRFKVSPALFFDEV